MREDALSFSRSAAGFLSCQCPSLRSQSIISMSESLADAVTLQAHFDTCTVCESVYPNPGELVFEQETQSILESWKNQLDSVDNAAALSNDLLSRLHKVKTLKLSLQLRDAKHLDSPLRISVQLPLIVGDSTNGLARIAVQSPAYLSRADGERLVQEVEEEAAQARANGLSAVDNAGYIMDVAGRVTALASTLWQAAEEVRLSQLSKKEEAEDDGELQRVWFWFPSLNTREKRKDLVNYAARWGLTGFVLAGTSPS